MDNQELLQAMQAMIEPIKKDLSEIMEHTGRIEERTNRIEEHASRIEERTSRIEERTSRIEERTSRIEERTTKTEILLENNIEKRLNLLGEGQQMVLEKFHQLDALNEKVDDIQTTVEVLKSITVKK